MEKNKEYRDLCEAHLPKSKTLKNAALAFLGGGLICFSGELLANLYMLFGIAKEDAYLYTTLTFILLSSAATAIGFFDKIATKIGAGALVPVTGFSNAVTSPAMDTGCEGYISGVGAKIFTVAGPVILFSSIAGVLYGIVYFFISLFI